MLSFELKHHHNTHAYTQFSHRCHHINISDRMRRSCSEGVSEGLSVQRLGCECMPPRNQIHKCCFLRGFAPPLRLKQRLSVFLVVHQTATCFHLTVPSCSRSLQIVRQMSSFTSTLPSGCLNNVSLCGFGFCIHSGGRDGGGWSYGWEINKTCHLYEQRWALRLFAALV